MGLDALPPSTPPTHTINTPDTVHVSTSIYWLKLWNCSTHSACYWVSPSLSCFVTVPFTCLLPASFIHGCGVFMVPPRCTSNHLNTLTASLYHLKGPCIHAFGPVTQACPTLCVSSCHACKPGTMHCWHRDQSCSRHGNSYPTCLTGLGHRLWIPRCVQYN